MDQGWLRGPRRIAALEKTGSTTECGCLAGDDSFEKTGERFIRRQLFVPALRLVREGLSPYTETVQYMGVLYY